MVRDHSFSTYAREGGRKVKKSGPILRTPAYAEAGGKQLTQCYPSKTQHDIFLFTIHVFMAFLTTLDMYLASPHIHGTCKRINSTNQRFSM